MSIIMKYIKLQIDANTPYVAQESRMIDNEPCIVVSFPAPLRGNEVVVLRTCIGGGCNIVPVPYLDKVFIYITPRKHYGRVQDKYCDCDKDQYIIGYRGGKLTCFVCNKPLLTMSTQTDPNAAYNAKVREVAEELAKIECDESTWDALDHYGQEVAISCQMRAARAVVDRELKSFKDGYLTAVNHLKGGHAPDWQSTATRRGLIQNTKTDNDA